MSAPQTPRYVLRCGKGYFWGAAVTASEARALWLRVPDSVRWRLTVWELVSRGPGRGWVARPQPSFSVGS